MDMRKYPLVRDLHLLTPPELPALLADPFPVTLGHFQVLSYTTQRPDLDRHSCFLWASEFYMIQEVIL